MAKKFVGVVSLEEDGEVRIQLTAEVEEQLCLDEGRVRLVTAERTFKASPA
jgi:hypothetical protein